MTCNWIKSLRQEQNHRVSRISPKNIHRGRSRNEQGEVGFLNKCSTGGQRQVNKVGGCDGIVREDEFQIGANR